MDNNVIKFPQKTSTDRFPISLEQSYEHIENVRRDYCDEVCADVMEAAFSVLASYGLTVKPNEENVRQIVLVEEAIKAMVYSTKNLHHSFQDLAETLITLTPQAQIDIKEFVDDKAVDLII